MRDITKASQFKKWDSAFMRQLSAMNYLKQHLEVYYLIYIAQDSQFYYNFLIFVSVYSSARQISTNISTKKKTEV